MNRQNRLPKNHQQPENHKKTIFDKKVQIFSLIGTEDL